MKYNPSPEHVEEIISGEFELLDHTGQPVNKTSYNGKLRLVFFGFTNCPDICPTTMGHVAKVMKLLGNKGPQVQPLFITIDHRNDTVDSWFNRLGGSNSQCSGGL
jgi:protein SCO1/2